MVTKNDIINSANELGINKGDSVIIHSSFKSFGEIENGADTVVGGFFEAIGKEGTLMFPTLCQNDWKNVYKNWHIDAPSDVGYLTNYFRKLPGAKRSNQASHSVAAIGKDAEYFTKTHGESGLRYGIFGDTPFASDSPWEKMYEKNTKVVMIGCEIMYCTLRHLAEYTFMDRCLKMAEGTPCYDEIKSQVWTYDRWDDEGIWAHIKPHYIEEVLKKENKIRYTKCGNADIMSFTAKDFVDTCLNLLENSVWDAFVFGDSMKDWIESCKKCVK